MSTIDLNISHASHQASVLTSESHSPSQEAPSNGVPVQELPGQEGVERGPDVIVDVSQEAVDAGAQQQAGTDVAGDGGEGDKKKDSDSKKTENEQKAKAPSGQELTEEEQEQVKELKDRDQEVRRHEQAHKAAAGQFSSGGPTFDFQRGPDGQQYAVGGEVQIDTSPVEGNPQATISKMEAVRAAALAPNEPSSQDRSVAAQAAQAAQQARQEVNKQEETQRIGGTSETTPQESVGGTEETPASGASGEAAEPENESPEFDLTQLGQATLETEVPHGNTGTRTGRLLDVLG